jgi:hypothetical protein
MVGTSYLIQMRGTTPSAYEVITAHEFMGGRLVTDELIVKRQCPVGLVCRPWHQTVAAYLLRVHLDVLAVDHDRRAVGDIARLHES